MPLKNALQKLSGAVTISLEFNMAASVSQDRGLWEPLQSMDDQTDVGIGKGGPVG